MDIVFVLGWTSELNSLANFCFTQENRNDNSLTIFEGKKKKLACVFFPVPVMKKEFVFFYVK